MSPVLELTVRCRSCGRDTADTLSWDTENPGRPPTENGLCDNCNYDTLPVPWGREYDEEDYDEHPVEGCRNCGSSHFTITWPGVTEDSIVINEDHWCYDCGVFHADTSGISEAVLGRTETRTSALMQREIQTAVPLSRGAVVACADCGHDNTPFIPWDAG